MVLTCNRPDGQYIEKIEDAVGRVLEYGGTPARIIVNTLLFSRMCKDYGFGRIKKINIRGITLSVEHDPCVPLDCVYVLEKREDDEDAAK